MWKVQTCSLWGYAQRESCNSNNVPLCVFVALDKQLPPLVILLLLTSRDYDPLVKTRWCYLNGVSYSVAWLPNKQDHHIHRWGITSLPSNRDSVRPGMVTDVLDKNKWRQKMRAKEFPPYHWIQSGKFLNFFVVGKYVKDSFNGSRNGNNLPSCYSDGVGWWLIWIGAKSQGDPPKVNNNN